MFGWWPPNSKFIGVVDDDDSTKPIIILSHHCARLLFFGHNTHNSVVVTDFTPTLMIQHKFQAMSRPNYRPPKSNASSNSFATPSTSSIHPRSQLLCILEFTGIPCVVLFLSTVLKSTTISQLGNFHRGYLTF